MDVSGTTGLAVLAAPSQQARLIQLQAAPSLVVERFEGQESSLRRQPLRDRLPVHRCVPGHGPVTGTAADPATAASRRRPAPARAITTRYQAAGRGLGLRIKRP